MDKKQQLKRHYEKLKETIQQAIRRDLENLRIEEEKEVGEKRRSEQEERKNAEELLGVKKRMVEMKEMGKRDLVGETGTIVNKRG